MVITRDGGKGACVGIVAVEVSPVCCVQDSALYEGTRQPTAVACVREPS